jgi:hypothetical protein
MNHHRSVLRVDFVVSKSYTEAQIANITLTITITQNECSAVAVDDEQQSLAVPGVLRS